MVDCVLTVEMVVLPVDASFSSNGSNFGILSVLSTRGSLRLIDGFFTRSEICLFSVLLASEFGVAIVMVAACPVVIGLWSTISCGGESKYVGDIDNDVLPVGDNDPCDDPWDSKPWSVEFSGTMSYLISLISSIGSLMSKIVEKFSNFSLSNA